MVCAIFSLENHLDHHSNTIGLKVCIYSAHFEACALDAKHHLKGARCCRAHVCTLTDTRDAQHHAKGVGEPKCL